MRHKLLSPAALAGLVAALAVLTFMTSCGGGSNNTTETTAPGITLSATTFTFTSAVNVASAAQTLTITNSGTATLTFSGFTITPSSFVQTNTCGTGIAAGATCAVSLTYTPTGTTEATGTLSIADNASGSPQTVSLTGNTTALTISPTSLTTFSVTTLTGAVTLSNSGSSAITISSIAVSTGSSNFSETNTCGTSLAGGATCTITVTFTPPSSGTVTGVLTITDSAPSSPQTVSLAGTGPNANTVQVSVNFGPNGYSTTTGDNYYNGVFTTVTVCAPGSTSSCTQIPNVLVDTGSVGLRVLGTAATGVTTQVSSLNLPTVTDPTTGYPQYECVQYGDLSYTWGPVQMATVEVGGETASTTPGGTASAGIPIQVISASNPPDDVSYEGSEYANPCLVYSGTDTPTGGANDGSVEALGANGILGVGNFPQDCGTYCTSLADTTGEYIAYDASTGAGYIEPTLLTDQVWNPVAAFSSADTNGVMLSLPSIAATGASPNGGTAVTGTLYFGINTQSNNQITSTQTVYEVDCDGDFLQTTYNGVVYQDVDDQTDCEAETSSFIDSGSNALYILDAGTLTSATGVTVNVCSDNGYYCPASTLNLSITLTGYNNTSVTGNGSISIASADSLFSGNENAAFYNLGGPSCVADAAEGITCSAGTDTDYFDFGLPFFFGKPIFVGIEGTNTTYPNGFWAF